MRWLTMVLQAADRTVEFPIPMRGNEQLFMHGDSVPFPARVPDPHEG